MYDSKLTDVHNLAEFVVQGNASLPGPLTLGSVHLKVAQTHSLLLKDQTEWEKWRSRSETLRSYARKWQQGLIETTEDEGGQARAAAAILKITTGTTASNGGVLSGEDEGEGDGGGFHTGAEGGERT